MIQIEKKLIYITDPMCSWCWGFSPVIDSIKEKFSSQFQFQLVAGGLRVGTTDPLTNEAKNTILHHWDKVHEMTSQPFDKSILEEGKLLYDTGPSCQALVTMRQLQPDSGFEFLSILHRAFYSENKDITKLEVLCQLAKEVNVDPDFFRTAFLKEETKELTSKDFKLSKELGVRGFPTLIMKLQDEYTFITQGYQPLKDLEVMLNRKLMSHTPPN